MKEPVISTTIVTCNRVEYTKRTIESLLKNTKIPHELIVVDNASTDGTIKYLESLGKQGLVKLLITNSVNKYPGFATNQGWTLADKNVEYLHRSDNDLLYKRDWDGEIIRAFENFPELGELGIVNEMYQLPLEMQKEYFKGLIKKGSSHLMLPPNSMGNVGGPCVIRSQIFFKDGLRWDERPWTETGALNEDFMFSNSVRKSGWKVYELINEKVEHLGFGDTNKYYNYYLQTHIERNLLKWFEYRKLIEKEKRVKKHRLIK